MFSIVHYKNLSWNQQWIGPSGRILCPLKHMVKGSIFASCIWEKKLLEEQNPPCVSHKFSYENQSLSNGGENFEKISW